MKTSSILLSTVAVLSLAACSKEPTATPTATGQAPVKLGERFDPPEDQIVPMVQAFHAKREARVKGLKESYPDIKLQEGLWLTEAEINFDKGDASTGYDLSQPEDSLEMGLHFEVKEDGEPWVKYDDVLTSYQTLLDGMDEKLGVNGSAYAVDVEIKNLGENEAFLCAKWIKRLEPLTQNNSSSILFPSYTGCWNVAGAGTMDDGSDVMTAKLSSYFHPYTPGLHIVSVSPDWLTFADIDPVGYHDQYAYYAGTHDDVGGPAWLASSPNGPYVCFPSYWQKSLVMRQFVLDHSPMPALGYSIVAERYDWYFYDRGLNPMSFGSPYYPIGPYSHFYKYKWGRRVISPIVLGH